MCSSDVRTRLLGAGQLWGKTGVRTSDAVLVGACVAGTMRCGLDEQRMQAMYRCHKSVPIDEA
jgi:hypothetical protein